jgi:hypothetical protein
MGIVRQKPEGAKKTDHFVPSAPEIQISDGAHNGWDSREKGQKHDDGGAGRMKGLD